MKKVQDVAGFFFVFAVTLLSIISILGIWDFFSGDVIEKSFETLGVLAVVAVVIIVGGKFMEGKSSADGMPMPVLVNPSFKVIRRGTVVILIVSASILALLGVLAIWDVITDKDVLYKSLSSLGTLVFASLVIVMTCLEREDSPMLRRQGKGASSVAIFIFVIVAIFVVLNIFRFIFFRFIF
ncbi:hypothetical protein EXS61_02320 [Candidatus Parcubacteria bacterium]|nr:hypothetical protein [Candidatus Parcubacteria bacterium]